MSTTPTEDKRSKQEIRVSMLPAELRGPVEDMKLDLDGDGAISIKELEVIIERLIATKDDNKSLRKQLIYMGIFSILLTCIIFGVSIAAARLSKETTVDPVTGIMSTKGTDQSIHTSPVSYYLDTLDVVGMKNDDLSALTDLILSEGAVELSVKGYSRSLVKNQVTFLVEGGTVLYGADGYVSATGTAATLLAFAADSDDNATSSVEGVRRLDEISDMIAARSKNLNNIIKKNLNSCIFISDCEEPNSCYAPMQHRFLIDTEENCNVDGGGCYCKDPEPIKCKSPKDCKEPTPICWVGGEDVALSDGASCGSGGYCFCTSEEFQYLYNGH